MLGLFSCIIFRHNNAFYPLRNMFILRNVLYINSFLYLCTRIIQVDKLKTQILALLLAFASAANAQNVNWTDHMSNLPPDTIPSKAHEDKTAGPAPRPVNIGQGFGADDYDADYFAAFDENGVDTAHQIILLIGDSMLDGLGSRFVDYAAENGDEFHAVIWYGSTTMHWATTRDLEYQINRVHPTFVIISLGYNDLGYYDFERRGEWISTIVNKLGKLPFIWIGPLPRRRIRDRRIVDVIREKVGENHFFDSSNTVCARLDGNHPTMPAAARWVDSIASWMSTPGLTQHPIRMNYPTRKVRFIADEKHTLKYHGR